MHDIFISYSREDRDRAERVARALEGCGWSVWWDRSVPAGRTFDEVIEEAIEASRCVMVLWSRHSVESRWVRTEAQEGLDRDALIPVLLDEVKIPLAFRRVQAANLAAWDGQQADPAFRGLRADIEALVGSPGPGRDVDPRPMHPDQPGAASPVSASGDAVRAGMPRTTDPNHHDGPTSWRHRHPRTWTGLRVGLTGGLVSGILGLMIFANDSRDFINPYLAALVIGAWAGVWWIVVGMAAGPKRAPLVGAAVGAVAAMLAWIAVGGTYQDVLGAGVMIGGPAGGLLGALVTRRFGGSS